MENPAGFADFLKYGPLGLAGLLSVLVLGLNVWKLFGLLSDPNVDAARIGQAKPILYAQMGLSLVLAMLVGGGALYLAGQEYQTKLERRANLLIDPWDAPGRDRLPVILVGGKPVTGEERPLLIDCTADRPMSLRVDLKPYLEYREAEAVRRAAIVRQTLERPQVDDSGV